MTRVRVLVLALALAMTAASCGGPQSPFELGLKEVPSDLVLGRQTPPALPLPAVLPPQAVFAPPPAPQGPTTRSTLPPPIPDPPRPPPPCRTADPRTPARLPVTVDIPRPPAPGTYTYSTSGFVGRSGTLTYTDPTAVHEVGNVTALNQGESSFDVKATTSAGTTTTTFHIVPRTALSLTPGLFISKVDSGNGLPFQPKPELLVLPFPALRGTVFNAAGSDGVTTVKYDGRIEETVRVDACGTPLDGILVQLTNGQATTGRQQEGTFVAEEFTATYLFAPQYGGISLADSIKAATPVSPTRASRELRTLIRSEPNEPGR